jgi:hypothetical protein
VGGGAEGADALAAEIADIKKEAKEGQRKFYVLETNVKGLIFIRFTDPRMQPVPFITRTPLPLSLHLHLHL